MKVLLNKKLDLSLFGGEWKEQAEKEKRRTYELSSVVIARVGGGGSRGLERGLGGSGRGYTGKTFL